MLLVLFCLFVCLVFFPSSWFVFYLSILCCRLGPFAGFLQNASRTRAPSFISFLLVCLFVCRFFFTCPPGFDALGICVLSLPLPPPCCLATATISLKAVPSFFLSFFFLFSFFFLPFFFLSSLIFSLLALGLRFFRLGSLKRRCETLPFRHLFLSSSSFFFPPCNVTFTCSSE